MPNLKWNHANICKAFSNLWKLKTVHNLSRYVSRSENFRVIHSKAVFITKFLKNWKYVIFTQQSWNISSCGNFTIIITQWQYMTFTTRIQSLRCFYLQQKKGQNSVLRIYRWHCNAHQCCVSISLHSYKLIFVTLPCTPCDSTHSKHSLLLVHYIHYMFSVYFVFVQCSFQSGFYLLLIHKEDIRHIILLKISFHGHLKNNSSSIKIY